MASSISSHRNIQQVAPTNLGEGQALANSSMGRPILLIVGPTPPPYHGVSVATQALLTSDLDRHYQMEHIELADRRGIEYVDKPDFHDFLLFIYQWLRLLGTLLRN